MISNARVLQLTVSINESFTKEVVTDLVFCAMTMIPIKSRKRRKNNVQKHVKKPFFGVSFRFNGSRNRPSYVGRPQSPMK